MTERLARGLYLASLLLLPWGALLPIAALHEHASWGDVVFAMATLAWAGALVAARQAPPLRLPALLVLATLLMALWRQRQRPTDRVTWGLLAAFALDGLGQDVEDFRHLWIALGLADAGRRGKS
ncbi:MAG TPA: hypothetical protein VMX54_05795 [Vicinamibacteria bacterium]|nr:hypothetical protein [Vicinamibacteria bacterium]